MNQSGSNRDSYSAIAMLEDSTIVGEQYGLELYIPKQTTHINDEDNKIKILHVGRKNNLPTKTILLIGETGAGKTTLLNALYNHFCGVTFQDKYRMKLFCEEDNCQGKQFYDSQTETITGYLFFTESFMPYDYNVMVIDTPGLNDTRGSNVQNEITSQMTTFLKDEKFGIVDLNCIGFVVKANLNRSLEYFGQIIENCMKLFGKNTETITHILKTYAIDKNCNVKKMFKDKWNIKTESEFNFDNGILYDPNQEGEIDQANNLTEKSDIDLRALRWASQSKETEAFFQILSMMPSVSLRVTKAVLKEKAYLEQATINLREKIKSIFTEFVAGRENTKMLLDYQNKMKSSNSWSGKETIINKTRIPLAKELGIRIRWYHFAAHVHNCKKCNKTCTTICHIWVPCPRLSSPCIVCKCSINAHRREEEIVQETVTLRNVNSEDIKAKFKTSDNLTEDIKRTIELLQREEKMLTEAMATMVNHIYLQTERLNDIARVKTCHSRKEIVEDIINSITESDVSNVMLQDKDYLSFLKSVADEIEKNPIDKEEWIKEYEQILKKDDKPCNNICRDKSKSHSRSHRRFTVCSQK